MMDGKIAIRFRTVDHGGAESCRFRNMRLNNGYREVVLHSEYIYNIS
jgi:hypothetical protein